MNYPRGLIRYTTENALHHKKTHVVRPRMLVYATLLLLLSVTLVTLMSTRTPIILDVIRDRNALYRELPGGIIENSYTLKIINQRNNDRLFKLGVRGVEGIMLDGVDDRVRVPGGGVLSLPVRARAQGNQVTGVMKIEFTAETIDERQDFLSEDSRFLGPAP